MADLQPGPGRITTVRPQWGDLHLFGYHCRIYNETVDLALSPHSDGRDLIFVPNVRTTPHIEQPTGRFNLEVDVSKALDAIDAYRMRTGR